MTLHPEHAELRLFGNGGVQRRGEGDPHPVAGLAFDLQRTIRLAVSPAAKPLEQAPPGIVLAAIETFSNLLR